MRGQQKELGFQLGWKQQGWRGGVDAYISEVEKCRMRQNLGCGMKEIVTADAEVLHSHYVGGKQGH